MSEFADMLHDLLEHAPRPWHAAKPEEVWVLTVNGEQHPWGTANGPLGVRFLRLGGMSNIPVDHGTITAGERIWAGSS